MRHLLILASLMFGAGATADEADFDFKSKKANIAIEKYEATIKKAKAVEKRNRVDLILALEAALKYERTEGELDEAIKIRDAIKALKKGASPAGGSTGTKRKARIPADAVKWNGHHYKVYDSRVSWYEARKRCNVMGGHLVRISDGPEQIFVQSLITSVGDKRWRDLWTDLHLNEDGQWEFSDGRKPTYFNWQRAFPQEVSAEFTDRSSRWPIKTMPGYVFIGWAQWSQSSIIEEKNWGNYFGRHPAGFICEWDE